MNKRQKKKALKKVVYPHLTIDEFTFVGYSEEEIKNFWIAYNDYVYKNFRYFHYRDKEKLYSKPCYFRAPLSKTQTMRMEEGLKYARQFEIPLSKII